MITYCLVCKKSTENANSRKVKTKNSRLQVKYNTVCTICGNNETRFISGSGLLDILDVNTPQNRMKNSLWNAFR